MPILHILAFVLSGLHIYCSNASIYSNLRAYDVLHASDITHLIVKRGVKHSNHPFNVLKDVRFRTLGKNFRLILHPNKEVLHSNFKAYTVDGNGKETPFLVEHDEFFHGRVFGEMKSHAHVHIENGVLTASIHMEHDIYHIEPKWRHLPDHDNKSMIAYRESDVKLSWQPSTGFPIEKSWPRTCGYVKEEIDDELVGSNDEEGDETLAHYREKRQNDQYEYTPTKTRCPLLLIADYRFYQEMGSSNTKTTINYLINLIDRVHKLYNDTTWQDGSEKDGFKGMGFVIKKIVVHSEPTRVRGGELHYNMIRDKWDVRNLLEVFSREYSHKDFCLAHLFTDLKFEGGILGLAYVGSPRRNSVGGICTPEYFKNGYTLYLNSGLSSSRNHYGQRVITREADLVTAHELGHNFGSEHDPDIPECSPSASQGGSYLMYTYSVSGYDVNNKKFSPCSLRSIRKVLLAKSGRCFTEPEESFCGNLRVEGDEECDAGLLGTEDNDACCDKNCKLRRKQGAACSDKNTPCCQNCQYMKAAIKCREAQYVTCEKESRCNGVSAECPKSPPMDDNTPCLEKGQCRDGKCIPYCETKGQLSCMCDDLLNACKRCCRNHLNDTCAPDSSDDILSDGTPCVQGFCNQGICEKTIQDVVERFWDIIEEISINKVLKFLKDNIIGATIVVCAVFWIPASFLISYSDRVRRVKILQRQEWNKRNELLHPLDTRKVIRTKMTTRRLFSKPPSSQNVADVPPAEYFKVR